MWQGPGELVPLFPTGASSIPEHMAEWGANSRVHSAEALRFLLPQTGKNPRASTATWIVPSISLSKTIDSLREVPFAPRHPGATNGVLTSEREASLSVSPFIAKPPQTGAVSAHAAGTSARLVFRTMLTGPMWHGL